MASLPPFKNFLPEDYPQAPTWFKTFLGNVNLFTLAAYNALNGNLNVFTNLAEARFILNVTGGASATSWAGPTSFKNPLGVQLSDLWITKVVIAGVNVYTPNTAVIGPIDWTASSTTVTLNAIPGLTDNVAYQITLRMAV
jgi:hypothetical protein